MNKMEYEEKSPNENKIKIIDKNTGQNPDAWRRFVCMFVEDTPHLFRKLSDKSKKL